MRIIYIGRHGVQDNEDEDAITFALRKLGHEVECLTEKTASLKLTRVSTLDADFLLFNKWGDAPRVIPSIKHRIPCVFWYFDLVTSPDLLSSGVRVIWHGEIIDHILVGFCTDGDWVDRDTTGKLVHLCQGADERYMGYGVGEPGHPQILFTGTAKHCPKRARHVEELKEIYGSNFEVIGDNRSSKRLHGRALANRLASSKIIVAPDGPNTDRYWSNRVYLTLGLGGFLIHPYCRDLTYHYSKDELVYYNSQNHLKNLIDYFLNNEAERERVRMLGHMRTLRSNLYIHRCEQLIDTVRERME